MANIKMSAFVRLMLNEINDDSQLITLSGIPEVGKPLGKNTRIKMSDFVEYIVEKVREFGTDGILIVDELPQMPTPDDDGFYVVRENDGSISLHLISGGIVRSLSGFEIFQNYNDIPEMLLDAGNQNENKILRVKNASDDPNLSFANTETKRQAFYRYNGVATGSLVDYTLISAPYSGSQGGVQSVTGDGVGGTPEDVVLTFPTPMEIGAIEDAPSDGKQYARKNEDWEEVEEFQGVETADTLDIELSGDGTAGNAIKADLTQGVKDEIAGKEDSSNKVQDLTNPNSTTYPSTQAIADLDLDDFNNESADPYVRDSEIPDPIDLSTGLEAIDEGNGIGWRLKGRNPDNYGNIGKGAIDLGTSDSASNSVGASGEYSNVGGGYQNEASGYLSTVGGGHQNKASSINSFVGGGSYNEVSGSNSFVGGGLQNEASGDRSFVGGGHQNKASVKKSTIGGGRQNEASGNYSTISGGYINKSSGQSSTVGGGSFNEASGDNSAVAGGVYNIAKTFGEFLGGLWATIKEGNATDWIGTDRVFGIGNGKRFDSRSDAFNVYKNGVAELPSATKALIDAAGGKAIPTKEWVQEQAIDPAPPFNPADHDLDEFKNESNDPFVRESEIDSFDGIQTTDTTDIKLLGDGTENDKLEAEITQAVKDDIANGVTAYGWGDHSSVGYQLVSNIRQDISNPDATTYPSTQAVHDALLAGIPKEEEITGTRYTNTSASGVLTFDMDSYKVFDLILTGNTDFQIQNPPTGTETKVIEGLVTGNHGLGLPSDWVPLPNNDDYIGSMTNHIVVTFIKSGYGGIFYSLQNII